MKKSIIDSKELEDLFEAMNKLKTKAEFKRFFRDLCTLSELQAMSERWGIVKLLKQKKTYREISEKTGASTATITRIAHWLNHGEGGYQIILDRSE